MDTRVKPAYDGFVFRCQKIAIARPAAIVAPRAVQWARSSGLITLGARMASAVWAWVITISGAAIARRRQPVAMRAIWRAGAAAVLISPAWKRAEVEHALAVTEPTHAAGDHPVLAELMPMMHMDEPITPGQRTFESPAPDSEALLVFSSGTTGMPKAVRHTHGSFAAAMRHWRDALQLGPTDRMQIALSTGIKR